eukprot:jgi/Chrzof1/5057/Cz15g10060.t1
MGPSGAGKTTLMDMLAQRKVIGNLSGQVLLGGMPVGKSYTRHTAYVPQQDNFIPSMTCWENLKFYAAMMMPDEWNKHERKQRCHDVLGMVGLSHVKATLVGGRLPGGLMIRGLSGGERKRLSFAVGILGAPHIIFLDEPTTGLDSFASLNAMGALKKMARDHGHVVLATIHQPRAAIWSMFNKITLLASGRLIYHGPSEGLAPWLGNLGYEYDAALNGVPSDWALDLVAINFHKPKTLSGHTMSTVEDLENAASRFMEHYQGAVGTKTLNKQISCAEAPSECVVPYPSGWFRQYRNLVGREIMVITRNPSDAAGRTLTFAWIAVFSGLLFYNLGHDATTWYTKLGLLFTMLFNFVTMPYISMSLYTADKAQYLADVSSKLYRPWV